LVDGLMQSSGILLENVFEWISFTGPTMSVTLPLNMSTWK
jgi:hypothetical protein